MNYKFEFKKLVFNKISICVFLICLSLNAFVAYERTKLPDSRRTSNFVTGQNLLYNELEGKLTNEKVEFVSKRFEELDKKFIARILSDEYDESMYTGYESLDYQLFCMMQDKVAYITGYSERIVDVREKAKNNVYFYQAEGATEIVDYNTTIYGSYSDRKLLNFYRTNQWKYYFEYSFSNLMIIFTIVIFLSGAFCYERESNMSSLIITSSKGKVATFFGKILVALSVSLIVTLVFSIEDFIVFYKMFDLKGITEPLYSIEEMAYTTFDITIVEYLLYAFVIKLVGIVTLTMVILLASSIMNTSLGGIVVGILGIIPFIVINESSKLLNPIALLQVTKYFETMDIVEIFGIKVSYISADLICSCILIVIILLVCYMIENLASKVLRKERV